MNSISETYTNSDSFIGIQGSRESVAHDEVKSLIGYEEMPEITKVGMSPDIGVLKKKRGAIVVKQKTVSAVDPYADVEAPRERPGRRLITAVRSPHGP